MVKQRTLSNRSLINCLALFPMCFLDELPPACNLSSKYALCKVSLESKIRAVVLSVVHYFLSGFTKVLMWHHCHQVLASFWTRADVVTTQLWYSRHDSYILLCAQTSRHRRRGPKSDPIENSSHPLCTAHFAPVLRGLPLLHGSGAGIPGIWKLIYSRYCGIGRSSGELGRQLVELTAQMVEMRQQSSSTAMKP